MTVLASKLVFRSFVSGELSNTLKVDLYFGITVPFATNIQITYVSSTLMILQMR